MDEFRYLYLRPIMLMPCTVLPVGCQLTAIGDSNECHLKIDDLRTEMKQQIGELRGMLQQVINSQTKNTLADDVTEQVVSGAPRALPIDAKPGVVTTVHTSSGNSAPFLAIATLDDKVFVTRDGIAQVSIYDTTSFQLQRQLAVPGLGSNPQGLATCVISKYLFISDLHGSCVFRVDFSSASSNSLIKWNVADNPRGLSVNGARNVLVAYYQLKKVQEYTPTGSLLREITDSNYLWHAVELLSSGTVAVSRASPVHGIFTASMNGDIINGYGNQPGTGNRQMDDPRFLAVDGHGYIFVADTNNNRIMVLNPSLTQARQLPLPIDVALQGPFALSLDRSRGRLYVGEHRGQNRLVVFDNVTNVGALFSNN